MTDEERNEVIAACAEVCDKRAAASLAFLCSHPEMDGDGMVVSAGVEAGDCAEAIRRLNKAYAEREDRFSARMKPWIRKLMAGEDPGPRPTREDA